MTANASLHTKVEERLWTEGQRYTSGRRRLVDVLERSGPLTLTAVLSADPGISQSSAYRNLRVLEELGVVSRIVTGGDRASYELAEDLTGDHHHHLMCAGCGELLDFELQHDLEEALERALAAVAERRRYTADHHRLDLVGRCSSCR